MTATIDDQYFLLLLLYHQEVFWIKKYWSSIVNRERTIFWAHSCCQDHWLKICMYLHTRNLSPSAITWFLSWSKWTLFGFHGFHQKASTSRHLWRKNRLHPLYYSGRSGRPWMLWTLFGDAALLSLCLCLFDSRIHFECEFKSDFENVTLEVSLSKVATTNKLLGPCEILSHGQTLENWQKTRCWSNCRSS